MQCWETQLLSVEDIVEHTEKRTTLNPEHSCSSHDMQRNLSDILAPTATWISANQLGQGRTLRSARHCSLNSYNLRNHVAQREPVTVCL